MKTYSTDQLSNISNDELEKEYLAVRSAINLARRNKEDSRELEIYYCYVSREYQTRDRMKKFTKRN